MKARIRVAQTRAVLGVNAEMIRLYWDIGRMIEDRQRQQGWGAGVIPRLSRELHNELPEVKGFSERNIKRMLAFYRAYADVPVFVPQPVAQIQRPEKVPQAVARIPVSADLPLPAADSLLWLVPWGHHALLLEKVKEPAAPRLVHASRHLPTGGAGTCSPWRSTAAPTSGKARPSPTSPSFSPPAIRPGQQTLKDPYIFDFLTLEEPFHERELKTGLVHHLEKFLLELGQGFAFVGRQYRLDVGDEDFYIDLLFYHLRLRAFVVIDLKTGAFKPEYAGKLNFYCNVVNDRLRHPTDAPTIGLILCQTKDRVLAEYALSGIDKPIGVSSYELTRALPESLQSALPTVDQIEAELAAAEPAVSKPKAKPKKARATKPTRKKPSPPRSRGKG